MSAPVAHLELCAPPTLWPYQAASIEALRRSYGTGHRAPLFVLPTGGGKTLVFAHITAGARVKVRSVLIVVHRRELARQASNKLHWAGVPHGIIGASVQPLGRRLDKIGSFDLIVLDEAHHARAETWRTLLEAQPSARRLGVTATPARLDGRGLGIAAGRPFDDLVLGLTTAELIGGGFLCRTHCFAPSHRPDLGRVRVIGGDYVREDLAGVVNTAAITGDAVEQYRRRADHAPGLAFCTTVAHAESVAGAFRDGGYRAAHVDGETPKFERDALIAGLAAGGVEVLTSCSLIEEGLDVHTVGAVILLRPPKSLVLHRQQLGRSMRTADGKVALIVNDHVGNCLVHGLPEDEPGWSLNGGEKAKVDAPVWTCRDWGGINPIAARVCECGYELPPPQRRPPPQHASGELAEITAERLAAVRWMSYREVVAGDLSEIELQAFARARGYKAGWVQHRLREQAAS